MRNMCSLAANRNTFRNARNASKGFPISSVKSFAIVLWFPAKRSSHIDVDRRQHGRINSLTQFKNQPRFKVGQPVSIRRDDPSPFAGMHAVIDRSEEHTSELQSH